MTDLWRFLRDGSSEHIVAIRSGVGLSARDLRSEAKRVRDRLSDGPSEPVFLYCDDAANFLAGLLGAFAAGRDVLLPGHAAPFYLREIGAAADRLISDMAGLDPQALRVSVGTASSDDDNDLVVSDSQARIGFFTSGSTGEPKSCIKSMGQLSSEIAAHMELWGGPKGPVVGTVSHQHIYGLLFRVLWPLTAGQPFLAERQELWETVDRHLANEGALISSPAHLSRIPDGFSLAGRLTQVFSSGGPLSGEAARDAFAKLGHYPVEILGSTETGGVAWRTQEDAPALWTPLPRVEIRPDEQGALSVQSSYAGGDGFVTMGDRVVLAPDGRFSLQARLDRVVKIEGKRVSLPRVEGALRDLDEVCDAAPVDLPERRGALGVAVVLSPEGERLLAEMGRFRYSRRLRQALAAQLEPMERPRLWRFVARIPENAQGKRVVADLRALFGGPAFEMPTIKKRRIDGDEAQFDLELNSDLRWFDGHFPGQPILPGVAQLHIAALLAEEIWGIQPSGREMSRIKFRRVMQPGDSLTLTLTRKGGDRLDFSYAQGSDVLASGAFRGGA